MSYINIILKKAVFLVLFGLYGLSVKADDGYRLWLKYDKISDVRYRRHCLDRLKAIALPGRSATTDAGREELNEGIERLLGIAVQQLSTESLVPGSVVAAKLQDLPKSLSKGMGSVSEGYLIREIPFGKGKLIVITASEDTGVLYGIFHFLRLIQTRQPLNDLNTNSAPKISWRVLNHWDNPDGSVKRGYAGMSIWKWDELPGTVSNRYKDYARANASIGINGVVLNNVNADARFLCPTYLKKVAALADVFRPYGIRVFLSANFAAPKILGGTYTADPSDRRVQKWWKDKTEEIYSIIPDFGGFLVKANSEGQPGPQDYNRSHADGANMMADALAPHGGVLIWRAFVYNMKKDTDRAKVAYQEFKPLDGMFRNNVLLQIKNGPLDFQPREPFSPLLGAMPQTSQALEFQLTQEYTGFSTHLVYLASLFKETFTSDTYVNGKGSTVAKAIDGSLQENPLTAIAGVSNIGDVKNWTRHPFAQANWYAFGRLAWNHTLSADQVANEWIRMTLTNDEDAIPVIRNIMTGSYEAMVNYTSPLGLTVLSAAGHHYGPQPWARSYYHKADKSGIGFDRTAAGSNAVAQYAPEVSAGLSDPDTCPETLLTWFHHVPWDYGVSSGRTFWEELYHKYHEGVSTVRQMQKNWLALKNTIDEELFNKTEQLLEQQEDEAVWWRDACLWYFARVSGNAIPPGYEEPRYNEEKIKAKDESNKGIGVTSITTPFNVLD